MGAGNSDGPKMIHYDDSHPPHLEFETLLEGPKQMGKPYNHNFFFKGTQNSAGNMKCLRCGNHIDAMIDDWVSAKKSKAHDWHYVTYHRQCYHGRDGWAGIEGKYAKAIRRRDAIVSDLKAVAEKHSITDAYSFADIAATALGENLETYFD